MILFYLLGFIFISIIVTIFILVATKDRRNYWRRVIADIEPSKNTCPSEIICQIGIDKSRKGIISYSLYGDYKKYGPSLIDSLTIIPRYMPGWQSVVYAAIDIPKDLKNTLINKGAEVIIMGPDPPRGHEGALWRFLPAAQELPFVSLDADDIFNARIAHQIKLWLKSNYQFGIFHYYQFGLPMTAGMWGSRNCAIPDIKERLDKYEETWFGFDEAFLNREIFPLGKRAGYWRSAHLPLQSLSILGGVILLFLILTSLKAAYFIKGDKISGVNSLSDNWLFHLQ